MLEIFFVTCIVMGAFKLGQIFGFYVIAVIIASWVTGSLIWGFVLVPAVWFAYALLDMAAHSGDPRYRSPKVWHNMPKWMQDNIRRIRKKIRGQ